MKTLPLKLFLLFFTTMASPLMAQVADEGWSTFTSSDTTLVSSYNWARRVALSYAHDGNDPVGPWVESALSGREAFCMRDVSHQSVGAHLLGLDRQNKNMMEHFAEGISEQRDWCTFWEINRYDKPCPADYANDSSFWYNLNANFDVLVSCLQLYRWTADKDYVSSTPFTRFHSLTIDQYVHHWMLEPERVMQRPLLLNERVTREQGNNFYGCRGIPSYTEGIPRLTMSADLLAVIAAAHRGYAQICLINGNDAEATKAEALAQRYRQLLEERWWDEGKHKYNMLLNASGQFDSRQGIEFLLRYAATDNPERINSCLDNFERRPQSIEMLSYQPALYYLYGRPHSADSIIALLPKMPRALYPEVSFGIIEGMVTGLMGMEPDPQQRTLTTAYLGSDKGKAELKRVPLWGGNVSLSHQGSRQSRLTNETSATLTWKAKFKGRHSVIVANGKKHKATVVTDEMGQPFSQITVQVPVHQTVTAQVRR
jgi:hypothetical protein